MKLNTKIAGPGQDEIETAVAAFMREQFDVEPAHEKQAIASADREGSMLAVVSLLLSIPGTVLAAMQIAEKLELKRRLNQLLGRINTDADEETTVLLSINDNTTLDLKISSAEQIIIALETEAKKD